jgi:hypothetical protein
MTPEELMQLKHWHEKEPPSLYKLLIPDFKEDAEGVTLTAGNLSVGREHLTVTLNAPNQLVIVAEKTERKRFLWVFPAGTEHSRSEFTYDLPRFKLTMQVTAQGATAVFKDKTLAVWLPRRTEATQDVFPANITIG